MTDKQKVKVVYAIRPMRYVKGAYEGQVEYMPGQIKSFIGRSFSWVRNEMQKAIEEQIPVLGARQDIKND